MTQPKSQSFMFRSSSSSKFYGCVKSHKPSDRDALDLENGGNLWLIAFGRKFGIFEIWRVEILLTKAESGI